MLTASSMNVDSKGNAALYSIREAKTCFSHSSCELLNIISNECANWWVLSARPCWFQSQLASLWIVHVCFLYAGSKWWKLPCSLWSRKDCLGSRLRDKSTNFFSFLCCVFTSLSHLEHLNSLSFTAHTSLFHWPLWRKKHACVLSPQSRPTLWPHVPFCSRNSSGKSNAVGCSSFSRGSFPPRYWQELFGRWGSGQVCSLSKEFNQKTKVKQQS